MVERTDRKGKKMAKVKVRLYGVVRLKTGTACFEAEADTLEGLKRQIPGVTPKEAKDLIVLVNGEKARRRYQFKTGDEVVLMSPAGGG